MRKLVLPKGLYIAIFVVFAILAGAQLGINEWVLYETEVGQVVCKTHDIDKDSESDIRLKMNCDGTKASTDNADVVLSWIKNPGPLNCILYERGNVSCEPRETPQ